MILLLAGSCAQAQSGDIEQMLAAKEVMRQRLEAVLQQKEKAASAWNSGPAITHSFASLAHLNCMRVIEEAQGDPMPSLKLANSANLVRDVRLTFLKALEQSCQSIEAIRRIGPAPTKSIVEKQTKAAIESNKQSVALIDETMNKFEEIIKKAKNE